MSNRELVVLGTSSQAPTRYRNHNGYFLRWDTEGLLFDPGEGTQRQMILAGVSARSITRIFVTHFHGDHCLGLPGVLQRLNLDGCPHPVRVYFPGEDQHFFERLRNASAYDCQIEIVPKPVFGEVYIDEDPPGGLRIEARPLEHRIPAYGYRISEPSTLRFDPRKLEALGLKGRAIGELHKQGSVELEGKTVRAEDVAEVREGMSFAFVMDTRPCDSARQLARQADLMVMESTYLSSELTEARAHLHCTAKETAVLAAEAGVRRLVLAHFSQRYEDVRNFEEEASAHHKAVMAARDLDRIPVPWGRKHED